MFTLLNMDWTVQEDVIHFIFASSCTAINYDVSNFNKTRDRTLPELLTHILFEPPQNLNILYTHLKSHI